MKKKKKAQKEIPGEELEPMEGEAEAEANGEPEKEEILGSEDEEVQMVKPEEQALACEPIPQVQPKISMEDIPAKYHKFL